ncbi:uncharacterized protein PAC_19291 [Phialocephala subalpina]|uniref:NACHT-NTPase and P-loop NTPases N-terminal domain-containing protein n=1 Tax=Phialocephala subalpina TaxID=576137 RepID=A0A1L7XWG3_9HELO|nr:uncharacterized protein PAC_19291 [Phialocephala subalpina]
MVSTQSALVNTILTKASGIFLWVALVVKSLRERLEETQDLSILQEEIDTLPDELEALFRYLLNTLSKPARTTAYKIFAMLKVLNSSSEEPPDLSLFAYSFLKDYTKDPEIAIQTPFHTKGLVEAINGSVKHIRRSIPEFLENREPRDEIACLLQYFEAVDAVSKSLVAELRAETYMSGTLDRFRCSWISALLGPEEYVTWKIRHDQSILNTDFETAVLVSIMGHRLLHNYHRSKTSTQILESLLERGLSPQAVIHTSTGESSIWVDSDRTVWENFVLMVALHIKDDRSLNCKKLVGKAFEKYLEYGADPSLWFSAGDSFEGEYQTNLEMRVRRTSGKIVACRRWELISVHPLFTKAGGISFENLWNVWILIIQESLLELIDRNIKQQEGRTEEKTTQEEHSWVRNAESTFTRGLSELTETFPWRLNTWFMSIKTSHIMTFGLGLFVAVVVPRL